MIGLWEIIGILVLIAIVYFVGKKAPKLARNTGESLREFKQGVSEIPGEIKKGMDEEPVKKKSAKKKTAKKSTGKKSTAKKTTKKKPATKKKTVKKK